MPSCENPFFSFLLPSHHLGFSPYYLVFCPLFLLLLSPLPPPPSPPFFLFLHTLLIFFSFFFHPPLRFFNSFLVTNPPFCFFSFSFWFYLMLFFPFFFLFPPFDFPSFFFLPFLFLPLLSLAKIFPCSYCLFPLFLVFLSCLPLFLLSFHALPPCLFGQLKIKFGHHQTMGLYWMAIKKNWSPFDIPPLSHGDWRTSIAIQHTNTIGWWAKFFNFPRGDEFCFFDHHNTCLHPFQLSFDDGGISKGD